LIRALDRAHLVVARDEFVAVTGPSGRASRPCCTRSPRSSGDRDVRQLRSTA